METIGADIVLQALRDEGVEAVFGYPGANSLPLYDRLGKWPVRHYLMRHEQAAAHAADGYARATGRTGVCLATSGPGATNLVTGIATAFMDSSPLVALTAQVSTNLLGRDAFQETDIIGITMPITKHSFQVTDVRTLACTMKKAFHLARSGRPGPVLVDLPRDILAAPCALEMRGGDAELPPRKKQPEQEGQLGKIARALNESNRPVIVAGGGVKLGRACETLAALVKKAKIPFVTTMMGIGAVPSPNGYHLGFIGTHGHELANKMVHEADFILALGTRFTDRSTSTLEGFAPRATFAQIDIDATSIGKNIAVELPFVGDIGDALETLLFLVKPCGNRPWLRTIRKERSAADEKAPDGGCGPAGRFLSAVRERMPEDTTVVADVGLNQIWTVRTWQATARGNVITSGGMGTMGFSLPAAIGAKVGTPEREVVVVTGDGGFQMNIQELATIGAYRLPVKIIVINNGHLGMIRQLQDLFYGGRFGAIELGGQVDFMTIARGFGIPARRVVIGEEDEEGAAALAAAPGPFLLEAVALPDNYVYPIIPPGRSNVEMIYGKELTGEEQQRAYHLFAGE
jgi:acetolactate synthase I/II/III large subunit